MSDKNKNIIIAAGVFSFVFFSRLIFAEHAFYDADTIGYALGSISYSLEQIRPHMPGYFLHIQIIRLLNFITSGPHSSIMFLSLFYSSAGGHLLIYYLQSISKEKPRCLQHFLL